MGKTKKMPIKAGTGQICSMEYAVQHPKTTVILTVPVGKRKK